MSIQLVFWCTQAKCVYNSPLTSLHVMRSPRPFLAIFEYCKQSKSEAGEGLRTSLCILFASNPACCQDYAICHFLRLLQSFQSLVTSSCSWSFGQCIALDSQADQVLDHQRQCWLKCKDLCSMVGLLKSQGRSAAELEEAIVECAG